MQLYGGVKLLRKLISLSNFRPFAARAMGHSGLGRYCDDDSTNRVPFKRILVLGSIGRGA